MEAKWIVLLVIFAFVIATYVRGMRGDANADWREILWPWSHRGKMDIKPADDQGRPAAAE